jgi:sugar O-acyltransferase (sialic acid O-acetyltransferase NeuD family)
MAEVIVWGAGGHGRVVAEAAVRMGYRLVGYADANHARIGSVADAAGRMVLFHEDSIEAWVSESGQRIVVLGVGKNSVRLARSRVFSDQQLPAIVHPAATFSASARLHPGAVVLAGAVINSSAEVGRAAIINTGAIIEHDASVGCGAHVSPGAVLAGGASLGEAAWVGANATVLPGVRIGAEAIVGAGSVVLTEVGAGVTVVGNPAQRIR